MNQGVQNITFTICKEHTTIIGKTILCGVLLEEKLFQIVGKIRTKSYITSIAVAGSLWELGILKLQ